MSINNLARGRKTGNFTTFTDSGEMVEDYTPVGISIEENHHMITIPIWWIGVYFLYKAYV